MTDAVIKTHESPTGTTNLGAVTFLDGADQIKIPKQIAVDADGVPIDAATEATLASANAKLEALDGVTHKSIGTQVTTSDVGLVTNTVMHGLSTGGGGGYVDVKVTPSGALVADTGGLTDAQLRASPVPVSGTITVSNPTAQGLTDAQLRATPVPVSGTVTANTGLTQPLTDAQLRATGEQVAVRDYGIDVSRGLVSGVTFQTLQGYNQATGTTNEPIWAQSGTTYPNITAAQTLTLSSSSALDTSAGTGARTVLVTYILFSTGAEASSVVTLNGQTAVTITNDGRAINGVRVLTAGSGGSNAGTLYVGYGALVLGVPPANQILATVVIGKNKTQQAIYTVPAGKAYDLMAYRIAASVLTFIQLRTQSAVGAVQVVEFDLPVNGLASFNSVAPSTFAAGTQIQLWAQTAAGAGAAGVILSGYLRSV